MGKRGYSVLRKITINMVLALTVAFLSGCSDSGLEEKNAQLHKNLTQIRTSNTLLESRLRKVELNNQNLQKELTALRDNNKGLNISLAKSELLFSQKHKAELEAERKKIDMEREIFKKERKKIDKEAYENAEITVTNKYIGVLIGVSILSVFLLILWFFSWKKNRQLVLGKESEIEGLKNEKKALESENDELNKRLNTLANAIEELKRKEKEGSRNQVVNKIDIYKVGREKALSSIRGTDHGN